MATPNRSALLTKAHKVLKKCYKPVAALPQRTVLEHALYGCCLENTSYELADRAFASLSDTFFDWNEIRVCTVKELAEAMSKHPEPLEAAASVRNVLQSVFDDKFAFDLELLRKENLGKAVKKLTDFKGMSPFVVAYVVQSALGGHSIPIDRAAVGVFTVLGIITDAEAAKLQVPGLERAIPKTKGVEFGSLLHQLAADYRANPSSTAVQKVMLQINDEAKDRFPKRGKSRSDAADAAEAEAAKPARKTAKPKKPAAAAPPEKKKAARKPAAPPKSKKASASLTKRKPR